MQLDQLHLQDHDYLKLPKKLLECCASVNAGQGSLVKAEIPALMKSIVGASTQAKSILDDVQDLLEQEHQENRGIDESDSDSSDSSESDSESEGEQRRKGGKKKKAPVSERKKRSRVLIHRYEQLLKSFNDASQSNAQLREAFDAVIKDLQLLTMPLRYIF